MHFVNQNKWATNVIPKKHIDHATVIENIMFAGLIDWYEKSLEVSWLAFIAQKDSSQLEILNALHSAYEISKMKMAGIFVSKIDETEVLNTIVKYRHLLLG